MPSYGWKLRFDWFFGPKNKKSSLEIDGEKTVRDMKRELPVYYRGLRGKRGLESQV